MQLYNCAQLLPRNWHVQIHFVYFRLQQIASDNRCRRSSLWHVKRRSRAFTVTRIDKMVSEVCNLFEIQNSDSYFLITFLWQRKSIRPLYCTSRFWQMSQTHSSVSATEKDICLICHNSMTVVRPEEVFGISECTFAPSWSDQWWLR
jgi:hypothetical protein